MKRMLILFAVLCTAAASASASGPALETDIATLERAIRCPVAFSGSQDPLILVHGTSGRPEDHWALGFQKVLPEMGFDVCTVRLPQFALGDIQIASEYVVHAVRLVSAASGKDVDIVGYSQGSLEPRWAVKWWPDVTNAVDDIITLAGPHHGALTADGACSGGSCQEAIWQMNQGSAFLNKLNEGDESFGNIDYTSIYSQNDEIVQPQPTTSTLAGATNVLIQDLCPGRDVFHGEMTVDAAIFAVVLDAATQPGPADTLRVGTAVCNEQYLPGLTQDDAIVAIQVVYGNGGEATAIEGTTVNEEPPLKPYALPEAAGVLGISAALFLLAGLRRKARRRDW